MSTDQRNALRALLGAGTHDTEAPPPFSAPQARAGFAETMARFPVRPDVTQHATELGGRDAVRVEPAEPTPGTILYFHGGWFLMGSPATGMPLTAELAARSGVAAVSLDYSLAPEHPFPAAIEDCLAAYRALLEAGSPASSIVLAGDSAGGGLAVTTSLAAREAGLPMPAGIVAFSPVTDHTLQGASMSSKEGIDPYFTRDEVVRNGALYAAGQDASHPLLSPAVTADLTGLPPMLLQAGTDERLLDDAVRLADRARAAEVDVVLDTTAHVPHVFQTYVDALDEAGHALDRAALFVRQRLHAG